MTAPKTPLSDLLRGTSQPSAQPNRSPASPDPSPSSGVGGWVLACLLAVVLIALTWQKFTPQPGPTPPDDQKREQVEPPTPQPAALDLKKHMLVVVRDKKTLNEDIGYTLTMQDDQFWGWAKSNLADVEVLEDEDEIAKQFLATISDKPPVVALVNTDTRDVVWTMPLPKGGTDSIRSKLK